MIFLFDEDVWLYSSSTKVWVLPQTPPWKLVETNPADPAQKYNHILFFN